MILLCNTTCSYFVAYHLHFTEDSLVVFSYTVRIQQDIVWKASKL